MRGEPPCGEMQPRLGQSNICLGLISNPASRGFSALRVIGETDKHIIYKFSCASIILHVTTMAPPSTIETHTNTISMQAPQSSQAAGAEKAKVKMQIPKMPVFEDKMKEREYLKGRLAAAFRIFGDKGYDEGTYTPVVKY